MKDVLTELARRVEKRNQKRPIQPGSLGPVKGAGSDPITADALYPRWANFIKPNDILFTETGSSAMGLAFALLPKGAKFYNQPLWGAIGYATPAAFGAVVAAPGRRVVLITGEGSHQLTAQEISQFGRRGLKPMVFVLNNSGYMIERLLRKDPDSPHKTNGRALKASSWRPLARGSRTRQMDSICLYLCLVMSRLGAIWRTVLNDGERTAGDCEI
jgi:indolepyruvate decarboxylase